MLESRFEEDHHIYFARLSGEVNVQELAQALGECFSHPQPVKALWEVRDMDIGFGLEEVTSLADEIVAQVSVPGRMAFVIGNQQFLLGIVDSVRNMRSVWRTNWQTFETEAAARTWLCEGDS